MNYSLSPLGNRLFLLFITSVKTNLFVQIQRECKAGIYGEMEPFLKNRVLPRSESELYGRREGSDEGAEDDATKGG